MITGVFLGPSQGQTYLYVQDPNCSAMESGSITEKQPSASSVINQFTVRGSFEIELYLEVVEVVVYQIRRDIPEPGIPTTIIIHNEHG